MKRKVQAWLARRGLALIRLGEPPTRTLDDFLAGLAGGGMDGVEILDGDAEPIRTAFAHFGEARIRIQSADAFAPPRPGTRLVMLDAGLIERGLSALPEYAAGAAWVLLRTKPVYHAAGRRDALAMVDRLRDWGGELVDVLQAAPAGPIAAAQANVYFVFAPARSAGKPTAAARGALALLSAPLVMAENCRRLGGRDERFQGGLCNPGAAVIGGRITLLARGERTAWPLQKRSWDRFRSSWQAVLIRLDGDLNPESPRDVPLTGSPHARTEDFRVFPHDGAWYANPSVVTSGPPPAGSEIAHEALATSVAVARFDPESPALVHLGAPALPRATGRTEKNWAMFTEAGAVHLLYSFSPYRLYRAPAFPALDFQPAVEAELPPAWAGAWRNSINPVPYDADHLLHVVHQVYPTKQYVFWAVLIARRGLRPVRISRRPVLRGLASGEASILYVSAALAEPGRVLFFGGLDDSSLGVWSLARVALDHSWVPLA